MLENLDTVIAFSVVMLLVSLMITALVQIVVSLSGLRGRNLFWGVTRLLEQVDPQLGPHASQIADQLLRHPAITHTWLSRAVAIRPEELVRLLKDLAKEPAAGAPQVDPWYRKVLRTITPARIRQFLARFFPHPAKSLDAGARAVLITRLAALVPAAPANAAQPDLQLDAVAGALRRVFPQQAATVDAAVRQVAAQSDALVQKVDTWFDSLMDRTSERFKLHTRFITMAVTVLFVLFFHVNAVGIFRQISTNPEVRAGLVQASGEALRRAEDVFAQTGQGRGQDLASAALQKMSTASDPLGQTVKAQCDAARKANAKGCTGGLQTRQEGEDWLRDRLSEEDLKDGLRLYDQTFSDVAAQNIKDLGTSMSRLRGDLAQTQVQIFPQDFELALPRKKEFLGLLTSILLLSLGAPFWYNVLRKLSDLRPVVARKVEGEAPKAQQ